MAVGSIIAALYQHKDIELTYLEGKNKLSIISVLFFLLIVELLYVIVKKLMVGHKRIKTGILLALLISVGLVILSFFLAEQVPAYFSGICFVTLFLMVIFFASTISLKFIEGSWPVERLLMVSYVIIFVLLFLLALSIITEEDCISEFLLPEEDTKIRKKKKLIKL